MFSFNPDAHSDWKMSQFELDEIKLEEFIETHLTFTDKESYLQWVNEWKQAYKMLSVSLRRQRWLRKPKHYQWLTPANWTVLREDRASKISARLHLAIRVAGKRKSWMMRNKGLTLDPVDVIFSVR